ncbi:glycosyltransferase family 2 protein [bacterium]|nr:glycosyltransferase family 2 protein [bacterium]
MIAKDEEATIGQTIKSALAVVDEIVVGDTGSTDNTRLIAEGYGARVIDIPWDDDFAAARNMVLAEARCDWILALDADERLQPIRPVELQKLMSDGAIAGYRVSVVESESPQGEKSDTQVRLFRNHPYVRYCYPVHETIEIALENWATSRRLEITPGPLTILHDMGDAARMAGRLERNRRLLRDATREYPYIPYFAYRLAAETLVMLDDEVLPVAGLNKTEMSLGRAWGYVLEMSRSTMDDLAYGPELAGLLSACRLARQDGTGALDVVQEALDLFPDDLYLRYRRGVAVAVLLADSDESVLSPIGAADLLHQARLDLETVLDEAATRECPSDKWRVLYPLRYLGLLDAWTGDHISAEARFNQALSIAPLYSHAWLGKADCACTCGEGRRAMSYYLRAVTTDEGNLSAWVRGCRMLEELGFTGNAKSWRSRAETLFPEYPGFRSGDWNADLLPTEEPVLIPS